MKKPVEVILRTVHVGAARRVVTLGIQGKEPAREFLLEHHPATHRAMKIIISKGDPNDPLVQAFAEPLSLEGEIECCKLEAVEELLQFMKREGINRTELAGRMGVPPSRITKMLDGSENLTIATLVRAGRAVGGELKIRFQPARKAGKALTPDAQTQAPSRTVYPTGKKSKSSPASQVLKPAKGKSGSIASKSLNPDKSIHRVAEDPTPYRTKRKPKA